MIRIGPSLAGIERYLLNSLNAANESALQSALRLATGKKYNSPADNPSAYLMVSKLQDRLGLVNTTLTQVNSAAAIGAQLQQSLDVIRTQLELIQSTLQTDADQSLTAEERAAAQTTIDTAIATINSTARTSINGRRILDGSAYFDISGINHSQIESVNALSVAGSSATISGTVTAAATNGTLTYTGSGNKTTAAATFSLTGPSGSHTFSVANNQFLSSVASDINQYSYETGVTASVSGNNLTFSTVNDGSQAIESISVTSGTFATTGTGIGTDATATINGQSVTASGNAFDVSNSSGRFIVSVQSGFSGAFSTVTVSDSRALKFALTTSLTEITKLNVHGAFAADFRGVSGSLDQLATGGTLSGLDTNTSTALQVVDEALGQLTLMEAQADAFAEQTVASSANLLNMLKTQLEDSITSINGVSEIEENVNIAHNDALAAYASAGLTLMQQQQASLVSILEKLAGLS